MTSILYAGIDPGKTGALVVLDAQSRIVLAEKCPAFGPASAPKDYDPHGMLALLIEAQRRVTTGSIFVPGDLIVGLENPGRVIRIPGRTIHATVLREGVRLWEGLLVGLGLSYVLLTPQRWQRVMFAGLPKSLDTKARSVMVCRRRWPHLDLTPGRKRKPDSDLADAANIAETTRVQHLGQEAARRGEGKAA